MRQLLDDLDNFHGDENREYFTIDKIRAVEITTSLESAEEERDRLKKRIPDLEKDRERLIKEKGELRHLKYNVGSTAMELFCHATSYSLETAKSIIDTEFEVSVEADEFYEALEQVAAQLQARDDALEKAVKAIELNVPAHSAHVVYCECDKCSARRDALRAIEAVKGKG